MNNRVPLHHHSEFFLYVIIVLLPTYLVRFSVFTIPLNLLDVIIVGMFALFCIQYHGRIQLGMWKYSMAAFALFGGLAVFVANDHLAALGLYKSLIILPMLVGCMMLVIKPAMHRLLYALAASVVFISLIGLIQYITGYGIPAPWNIPGSEFRVTSVYEYPNAIGLLFAPVLAMLIAWAMHIPRHRKTFIYLALLGLLLIVLSRTEGAIIAVTIATLVSALYTRWKWVIAGITILGIIGALLWQPTRDILLFQDTSGEVRLALWQGTINVLKDNAIFGGGLGGFPELYAQYKLDRHVELLLYPHNLALDFWVELGIAGVVWLIIAIGGFFKRLYNSESQYAIVLGAGMVAILVYGLVDVPYFKNDLAVQFWIILTMSSVISKR